MQIFPRSLNKLPLVAGAGAALALPAVVFAVWYWFSPWYTDVGYEPRQPVAYSHRLHAGELGIDCRYCHTGVEKSPVAMVPPTQTCMNCHSAVKGDSAKLALVRDSWKTGKPIQWVKVHKEPDYVFFDHSVHVSGGVGCVSCHGRIDQEEVVRQTQPLSMGWCLECHRDVKQNQGASAFIRPVSQVTNMEWVRKSDEVVTPPRPLNPPENCGGCHR